jgi:hypothetical protein
MLKFVAGVFVGLLLGGGMVFIQTNDEFAREARRLEALLGTPNSPPGFRPIGVEQRPR